MTIEALQKKLESLICWIRERPESYCRTAGELETLLGVLHMIWAVSADRDRELMSAQVRGRKNPAAALLKDEECGAPARLEHKATRRVVSYYDRMDKRLGIQSWNDSWYDHLPGVTEYLAKLRQAGIVEGRTSSNTNRAREDHNE